MAQTTKSKATLYCAPFHFGLQMIQTQAWVSQSIMEIENFEFH